MTKVFLNALANAVPEHEVHRTFMLFAERLLADERTRKVFTRFASRSAIERRWSCIEPDASGSADRLDNDGFYRIGAFPSTSARMLRYEREAPDLAEKAIQRLNVADARRITHLIVTSCTGFAAPGVDFEIIRRCNLDPSIERYVLGFMGCNAAMNALKLARHIVRSEGEAKVLVVCVELCTLHLQQQDDIESLMTYLLFADGCAAGVVSAEPVGIVLEQFHTEVVAEAAKHISWRIGDQGFDMSLSSDVPACIGASLRTHAERVLIGKSPTEVDLWAVHPGGRAILDAVENAFSLPGGALEASRQVLRNYGNMSSPTVLFVLEMLMAAHPAPGLQGCAMAFGPGLSAETMMFKSAGQRAPRH
jgi:predicted naringenin-chalcone synthase